jgi:hypothetical protein
MASFPVRFALNDPVLRVCGTCAPERLRVSALTPDFIIAGPFRFDRLTLTEVDDFNSPGPSYLVPIPTSGVLGFLASDALRFPGDYL